MSVAVHLLAQAQQLLQQEAHDRAGREGQRAPGPVPRPHPAIRQIQDILSSAISAQIAVNDAADDSGRADEATAAR